MLYILCVMAGALIGALAVCMCVVAGDADSERIENHCEKLIKEIKGATNDKRRN